MIQKLKKQKTAIVETHIASQKTNLCKIAKINLLSAKKSGKFNTLTLYNLYKF